MLENTLLVDELTRLSKFPIWNKTLLLIGGKDASAFVAERVVTDEGQNHPGFKVQFGSSPVEGVVKNMPFEPLSMKLEYETPFRIVTKSPNPSVLYFITPEEALLGWVSIPSTRMPLTEGVPDERTLGSSTITPLLSVGSFATGFVTCLAREAVDPAQTDPLQE